MGITLSKQSSRQVVNQLPHDMITEILVRLPVKSLLRFKCVSKSWLSLITNPEFIKSHFSKSSSVENLELLFATQTSLKKCSLYSALHEADPSMHISATELPAQNGLVCLNLKGSALCVWNPALNKIKHLYVYPEPTSGLFKNFSFGYDESNNDYKVVCLQTIRGKYVFKDAEVRIYSLKADSWRRIDQSKGLFLPGTGVFANGKIYWSREPPISKIVSLDLCTEKFVESQPPKYDEGWCILKMGVSGGRPFVLCDYQGNDYEENKVDLWVLDNLGVEECWCKLVSIRYIDVYNKWYCFNYEVLCILSNCEIIFGGPRGLLVYNWKNKEYRKIKLEMDVGITTHMRAAAYVESLIWPNYA